MTEIADLPADRIPADGFECGADHLNRWLTAAAAGELRGRRARLLGAWDGERLVGYAAAALTVIEAPGLHRRHTGSDRRGQQQAGYVLAKLAVDRGHQGRGIGAALVSASVAACGHAAREVGGRIIVVDFREGDARLDRFYSALGFEDTTGTGRRVMLVDSALAMMAEAGL